ncbi:restriction endonuclease subunit S [Methylomicrobium lacus]|uniref:restriction endonuclease subunit S n=1 Tax=Methylomicrobium lacus TaxID=136992 RepID=UPI0035A82FE7
MSSEWTEVEVGDVCSVGDGAHSKVSRQTSGVPYLTSKNIGRGQLKLESFDYISHNDFERLFPSNSKATRRPQAGDILIGIIGTFGNAYVYKKSDIFGFSSSIGVLRPDKTKILSDYLYYIITSQKFRAAHENCDGGSVQGYTNIPTIKKLKLPLPPIGDQKKLRIYFLP